MQTENQIARLSEDVGFVVVDEATMLGEPGGVPATITVLSVEPLALMLQFRIDPDGTETQTISELLDGATDDEAKLEISGNVAVFTMYDMAAMDNESIALLVNHIATTLLETDFAIKPGCLKCSNVDSAELMYANGRPTRLCQLCCEDAIEQKKDLEEELNRPTRSSTLGLFGAIVYGVTAWGLFWASVEIALQHWKVRVIEINKFTGVFGLLAVGAVGYGVGRPIGKTLRRSFALRKAPRLASCLIASGVGVGGEVVMLTLLLLYDFGVFDLRFAVNFIGAYVSNYSGFWILCKLLLLGSTWFFCSEAAAERKTVTFDV